MTLVELALILAFLVWGFVYLIWRTGVEYRRNVRGFIVHRDRERRRGEDAAWALRQAEYERAMTLTLQRADCAAVESLVAALERAQVVA